MATAKKTPAPLSFTSAKNRAEAPTVEFELDGETYTFTRPKTAALLLSHMLGDEESEVRATMDWLQAGLSEEQSQRIIDRLRDPEDSLDVEDIGAVANGLMEEFSGRPTS